MNPVTDPEILSALEAPDAAPSGGLKPVADPGLIEQLEMTDEQAALRQKARKQIEAVGGPGMPNLASRLPVIGPYLDEASAAIQGAVHSVTGFGRSYDEAMAFNNEREAMARKENPVYDAVGGLAAGVALGGGPLSKLFTARTMPGMMAQGGLYGAGMGYAHGYGEGEGDKRQAVAQDQAASSAILGTLAPPAFALAGKGVSRVYDAVSPTLARWGTSIPDKLGIKMSAGTVPANPGAEAAADQVIANQLVRAGVRPEQLRERMAQADEAARMGSNSRASNVVAPVDIDPSLQRLAGSVGRQQPEARNIAQSFIVSRQTGNPTQALAPNSGLATRPAFSKPIDTPTGQYERVSDALKRALQISDDQAHGFKGTAYQTDRAILKRAQDEAQPAYKVVYEDATDLTGTVAPVLQKWQQRLIDEPEGTARRIEKMIGAYTRALSEGGSKTHLERLDRVKQEWDGLIGRYFQSSDKQNRYIGGRLNEVKNDILAAIDNIPGLGQKYQGARSNYSSHMEMRDALDMGRQAWKADSEISVEQYRALSEGQKKLFRLGLWDGFKKEGANAKRTADITQKFENPRVQELLQEVIPASRGRNAEFAQRAERFGQWLENEKAMIRTRNEVLGGSPTAERLADDKSLNAMMTLVEEVKGQPTLFAMGMKAMETALSKLFGFRADTAAAVSRKLFTASPAERERLLQMVEARMTPDRAQMLGRYLQQYRQLVTQSGTLSAGGGSE